ncbi:hypothetical protein [Streptomyces sp. CBMA29]|uniref:hypothetical protein n=1 Tax=Streptomyces sp. CBMA29 TaxID=1896314 RepID=UPI001661FCE0|nr:hypothetical protein [Streptomyces sp. CBMA29]MBD0733980.1 hypothetical protein [Streptomyces sp. CBMA29]
MRGRIIEVTNGPFTPMNWGKFLVQVPVEEWAYRSAVSGSSGPLLGEIGWGTNHIIVFDLQTMEGAAFEPGGVAAADLKKHRIHVCLLFEPFLEWLYDQVDVRDLDALPDHVHLPDTPMGLYGYRRPGVSA